MQDTTTSAMTEVALGLSMAFFTLLILALLSVSVPKESALNSSEKQTASTKESLLTKGFEEKSLLKIQQQTLESKKENTTATKQFAFYFQRKLYDEQLTQRQLNSFTEDIALVVAVDPNLAFTEVFDLRQKINHPHLSITTLNSDWQSRLQQMLSMD